MASAAAPSYSAASWGCCRGEEQRVKTLASARFNLGGLRGSWTKSEKLAGERTSLLRVESTATERQTKKKMAKLYVKKKQTVPLPTFSDASGNPQHLSVFLREPEGRQCMLNTKTLRKYEHLGDGVFKCYLPTMEFLSFEVAPVIDLQVDAKEESCQVDLLGCKFEGSELIRSQNERFSASLKNHISWTSTEQQEQHLHVRLELNVALEVYTLPFTVLPISAVESPGTLILQALVDRLTPLFLDQLLTEYQAWAEAQIPGGDDGGQIARLEETKQEVSVGSRN